MESTAVDKKTLKAEARQREVEKQRQRNLMMAADIKADQDRANKIAGERKAAIELAPVRFGTIVGAIVVGNLITGLITAIAYAIIRARM